MTGPNFHSVGTWDANSRAEHSNPGTSTMGRLSDKFAVRLRRDYRLGSRVVSPRKTSSGPGSLIFPVFTKNSLCRCQFGFQKYGESGSRNAFAASARLLGKYWKLKAYSY